MPYIPNESGARHSEGDAKYSPGDFINPKSGEFGRSKFLELAMADVGKDFGREVASAINRKLTKLRIQGRRIRSKGE
jgi:hypothetical protein